MTLYTSLQVSPSHYVGLHEDYLPLIRRAPLTDFVVRSLASRTAGDTPLMSGELVIAGQQTRDRFPLAAAYPLHFRKTYYPGALYGDPEVEFRRHALASTLIDVPPPIGFGPRTFRSCLLPGRRFDLLFELGVEPEDRNRDLAQRLELPAAAGLWTLAERALAGLAQLHAGGLSHRDAHWHNFVVCPTPLSVVPIDFERSVTRDAVDSDVWRRHCDGDREHLLRLAIYLQCALGRQRGELANRSLDLLDELVRSSDSFRRAIDERTLSGSFT